MRAKRDPEGRRRAIIDAALELIAQGGLGRLTHRAIAARAGVPLGATTYYFPTLNDVVLDCLDVLISRNQDQMDAWATRLAANDGFCDTVVELVESYLGDRRQAGLEYELYSGAARDERLRGPASAWVPGLQAIFRTRIDAQQASVAAMLVDGAILQALATGEPLDSASLRLGISMLEGTSPERWVGGISS